VVVLKSSEGRTVKFPGEGFYVPAARRTPDGQYKALLREILRDGHEKDSVQGVRARTVLGARPMRFALSNGAPLITERDLAFEPHGRPALWRQAIGEVIAYINGARTLAELEAHGCHWWGPWATEERCRAYGLDAGDFGPAFYGEAFARFPRAEGGAFNQIAEVIEQIKTNPTTRTHFVSPWIPQHLIGRHRRATITPCTGWMYFEVYDGGVSLCMTQRAGDVPLGVPFNTFQYAALLLMVAHVTGLVPREFVHSIIDAHIYIDQLPAVEAMLARDDRAFPVLHLTRETRDIFEFRAEDFALEGYDPHPAIRVPVSV